MSFVRKINQKLATAVPVLLCVVSFIAQAQAFQVNKTVPNGGGISSERYRFSPYEFATVYPSDWVAEGVRSEEIANVPKEQETVCQTKNEGWR